MTPTLHFVFGKPGAGKTSLARELAVTESAVLFCEDEWLAQLCEPIRELSQYVAASRRLRAVIEPLVIRLLALGVSVVLDFAGNTVRDRAWVRSLFERGQADHVLHVLDISDAEAHRRVRDRNTTRPAGLYFGDVAAHVVDAVIPHVVLPTVDEGFTLKFESYLTPLRCTTYHSPRHEMSDDTRKLCSLPSTV